MRTLLVIKCWESKLLPSFELIQSWCWQCTDCLILGPVGLSHLRKLFLNHISCLKIRAESSAYSGAEGKKKQQCCERNRKKKESGSKRKNRTNSILCGHVAPYFVEAKKQRRYRDCLGPGTAQHSPEKHTCTCTQTHTHACMHTVLEVLSAVCFSRGCTPSLTVRDSSCFRRIKILTWVQQSCRHRRDEYQKVQRKCWINRRKTVTYHAVATCLIVLHAGEF